MAGLKKWTAHSKPTETWLPTGHGVVDMLAERVCRHDLSVASGFGWKQMLLNTCGTPTIFFRINGANLSFCEQPR